MSNRPSRSIVEIFGYDPNDVTPPVRTFWKLGACPFTNTKCIKENSEQTITYGTCSVSNKTSDVIICPNRFYADKYKILREVSESRFGNLPFFLFGEYVQNMTSSASKVNECVIALGQNSGKEVKISKMSMDWVLARIKNGKLIEYLGIEVQSLDITGNYRENWNSFKELADNPIVQIAPSGHGLNWANVHKRLIPQLIRKGNVYNQSKYVNHGIHFIAPEAVYQRFEEVIGTIPYQNQSTKDTMTVRTFELGPRKAPGQQRDLLPVRELHFSLQDFAERFIKKADESMVVALDERIKQTLGVK